MRRAILLSLFGSLLGVLSASSSVGAVATPDIVSIGDSVAAGAGLSTASGAQNQLCDRSKQSYPYVVAGTLRQSLLHLPCYGAKIDEGIYGAQQRGDTRISAQLPRAFRYGTPKTLLVTIGANDLRWTELIQKCYAYSCGSKFDTARTAAYRADIQYELSRMIYEVRHRSDGTPPRLYLSGYYLPFTDASCIESSDVDGKITTSEQSWVASQTKKLNTVIERIAHTFSGVEYVPLDFTGHEACSSDSWVQGIDGNVPLHPTADGQRAIAQSFLREIRD